MGIEESETLLEGKKLGEEKGRKVQNQIVK